MPLFTCTAAVDLIEERCSYSVVSLQAVLMITIKQQDLYPAKPSKNYLYPAKAALMVNGITCLSFCHYIPCKLIIKIFVLRLVQGNNVVFICVQFKIESLINY